MISEPPNLRSAAAETGPPVLVFAQLRKAQGPVWSCPKEGTTPKSKPMVFGLPPF